AGISDLSGRRQEAEDAEALSALTLRLVARPVSHEVGPSGRLSDGGVELCGAALGIRQEDRARAHGTRQGTSSRLTLCGAPEFVRRPDFIDGTDEFAHHVFAMHRRWREAQPLAAARHGRVVHRLHIDTMIIEQRVRDGLAQRSVAHEHRYDVTW